MSSCNNDRNTWKTEALVVATNAVDAADKALLPGTFRTLEIDFNLRPKELAALVLVENVLQSLATPIWGYFSDRMPRRRLLMISCTAWGVATCMVALAPSFGAMFGCRLLSALALGSMMPISQSVLTDLIPAPQRGRAFGRLGFWSSLGGMGGGAFSTAISGLSLGLGGLTFTFRGWRCAFGCVGALSLGLASLVRVVMVEPPRLQAEGRSSVWALTRRVVAMPTWLLLVAQGMIGNVPWVALGSFAPMFFQYLGFSSAEAASLFVVQGVAGACGSYLGGWLGDFAQRTSPRHGRIAVAQISVAAGMAATWLLLYSIPQLGTPWAVWASGLALVGLVATWTPAAALRPIVTDISDEETRGFVLGYWLALEGCASAIGAPMVAYLSQDFFGYTASNVPVTEMAAADRQANAQALGQALGLTMLVPWSICFMFFTAMHWTYPADFRRSKHAQQEQESKGTAAHNDCP